MGRRSTLELLRTLRRRDRERQGQVTAAAVRASESSSRAERAVSAERARTNRTQQNAVAAEYSRVDSGLATAGELMLHHRTRRIGEERLRELDAEAHRAGERAESARAAREREEIAFQRVDAAEVRVREAIAARAASERARDDRRDEDAANDHFNSNAASRRSRGGT